MISFSMFLPTLIKLPFLSKTNLITYLIIAACKKNPPKQFFSELPNCKEKHKKTTKKTQKKNTKKNLSTPIVLLRTHLICFLMHPCISM